MLHVMRKGTLAAITWHTEGMQSLQLLLLRCKLLSASDASELEI